jgi:hypothetical protein
MLLTDTLASHFKWQQRNWWSYSLHDRDSSRLTLKKILFALPNQIPFIKTAIEVLGIKHSEVPWPLSLRTNLKLHRHVPFNHKNITENKA